MSISENRSRRGVIRRYLEPCGKPLRTATFFLVEPWASSLQRRAPIWFGGESARALGRVAEYGDGWIGFNLLPDEAAPKIKRIHELMKQRGRNPAEVELGVSPNGKPITPDDLKRYRDLGVEEVTVVLFDLPRTERDLVTRLERMACDYLEPAMKL